jgi:hypothetical protein
LTLLAGWNGFLFVYRALVPSTLDLAKSDLSYHSRTYQRLYLAEQSVWPRGNPWERSMALGKNLVILDPVESLEAVSETRLGLADGWIYPRGAGAFHQALEKSVEGRDESSFAVDRFDAKWFESRGPDIAVVTAWLRPRSSNAPVTFESCGRGCVYGQLTAASVRREVVAFEVWIPARDGRTGNPEPTFEVGGRSLAWVRQRIVDGYVIFDSERLFAPKSPAPWVLRAEWPARLHPEIKISSWQSWDLKRRAGKADEVRVGEPVEPGQIDPGQHGEGDDDQSHHRE